MRDALPLNAACSLVLKALRNSTDIFFWLFHSLHNKKIKIKINSYITKEQIWDSNLSNTETDYHSNSCRLNPIPQTNSCAYVTIHYIAAKAASSDARSRSDFTHRGLWGKFRSTHLSALVLLSTCWKWGWKRTNGAAPAGLLLKLRSCGVRRRCFWMLQPLLHLCFSALMSRWWNIHALPSRSHISSTCRWKRLPSSWRRRPSAGTWGTYVNVVWVSLWESVAVISPCVTLWLTLQLRPRRVDLAAKL